jgi:hypothetical protein
LRVATAQPQAAQRRSDRRRIDAPTFLLAALDQHGLRQARAPLRLRHPCHFVGRDRRIERAAASGKFGVMGRAPE